MSHCSCFIWRRHATRQQRATSQITCNIKLYTRQLYTDILPLQNKKNPREDDGAWCVALKLEEARGSRDVVILFIYYTTHTKKARC